MKNFVYVLIISLMTFNPVFLLAKHNFTKPDNMPPIEEIVEFQLSILDEVGASFDQAEQLENGNYQIQMAGSGGILALIAYTLTQVQRMDPSDIRMLDQAREFAFQSSFVRLMNSGDVARGTAFHSGILHLMSSRNIVQQFAFQSSLVHLMDSGDVATAEARLRELAAVPNDIRVALHLEQGGTTRIYNSSDELFDVFRAGPAFADNPSLRDANDRIRITRERQTPVDITYDRIQHPERPFVIRSSQGPAKYDMFSQFLSYPEHSTTASFDTLGKQTTNAINSSPDEIIKPWAKTRTVLRGAILPIGLGLASLLFANDAEAGENGQMETAPVEITSEDFEQIQHDIDAARDSLFSLL